MRPGLLSRLCRHPGGWYRRRRIHYWVIGTRRRISYLELALGVRVTGPSAAQSRYVVSARRDRRAHCRRSGRQPGWRRGCPALRRTGRSGRGI